MIKWIALAFALAACTPAQDAWLECRDCAGNRSVSSATQDRDGDRGGRESSVSQSDSVSTSDSAETSATSQSSSSTPSGGREHSVSHTDGIGVGG